MPAILPHHIRPGAAPHRTPPCADTDCSTPCSASSPPWPVWRPRHLVAALHRPRGLARARRRLHGHRPDPHPGQGVGDQQLRHQRQADPDRLGVGRRARARRASPGSLAAPPVAVGAALLVVLAALAGVAALTRPGRRARSTCCPAWSPRSSASSPCALARTRRERRPPTREPTRRPDAAAACCIAAGASRSPPPPSAAPAVDHGYRAREHRHRPSRGRRAGAGRCRPASTRRSPGSRRFRTPNGDFYRVDTRLTLPIVDVDAWTLTIDGDVDKEVTLHASTTCSTMPLIERDITLTCVSNDVGGKYIGAARWLGVPLTDAARPGRGRHARPTRSSRTDVDGMTICTPLDLATDGRDAMVVIGMNGEPLPREHGFPARMVVPGLYGFVSATKWLTRLTLTTYAEQEAYWTERDWATDAPIKISSRIDTPKPLARITPGGPSSAASPGRRARHREGRGPHRRRRLAARPSSAPTPATTTGASGTCRGTPSPASTCSPCRAIDSDGDVQTAVRGDALPRRAPAASRRSSSTSPDSSWTPTNPPHPSAPNTLRNHSRQPPTHGRPLTKAHSHEPHPAQHRPRRPRSDPLPRPRCLRRRRRRPPPTPTPQRDQLARPEPTTERPPSPRTTAARRRRPDLRRRLRRHPDRRPTGLLRRHGHRARSPPPLERNPLLKTLVAAVTEAGLGRHPELGRGASPSSPRPTTRSPRSRRRTSKPCSPTRRC